MLDEQDGDIFDLQLGEKAEETSSPPKKQARKKKTLVKKPVKKKKKAKKPKPLAEEEPRIEEDLTFEDTSVLQESKDTGSETRIAQSIDRSTLTEQDQDVLADTMPKAEDPVTKAKRENPAVARWDSFLGCLSRGTMELLYEMGISGLEEGSRPLVNFCRSDLLKPSGVMLEQHVDAIEGEMAEFNLTLLPEADGVIRPGDRLPRYMASRETRTRREIRRRNLRSTM